MEIQKRCDTSFGMRFVKNQNYIDTIKYAHKTGKLLELDSALNILNNVNEADVLIMHGKNGETIFSNFSVKNVFSNKTVPSIGTGKASCPEEATLFGILDLSKLNNSINFRRLVGGNAKSNLTASEVLAKY